MLIMQIGFIGRLDYQKGVDIILSAIPELMQDDVQFVGFSTHIFFYIVINAACLSLINKLLVDPSPSNCSLTVFAFGHELTQISLSEIVYDIYVFAFLFYYALWIYNPLPSCPLT